MVSMASKKFPTDSYDLLEFIVVFIIFESVTKRNVVTYSIHKPNTNHQTPPTPLTTYLTSPVFFFRNPRKHLEKPPPNQPPKPPNGSRCSEGNGSGWETTSLQAPKNGWWVPRWGRGPEEWISPWCFFGLGANKRRAFWGYEYLRGLGVFEDFFFLDD